LIGYPEMEIPPAIEVQIDDVLTSLIDLVDIKGGFGISDSIFFQSGLVNIENTEFQTKKIISRSLNKATSMAIFACTIGDAVSNWASRLIKEDALKGYIADVAASAMAEKTAGKIQDTIEEFSRGQAEYISNRYSPGYCGWSVADQHLLFSLLPDNFCGITLNDAALMHPIKSVSGIIGIGKEVVKNPYQCNICDITDCIMSPLT
jgi:hypothetical protein